MSNGDDETKVSQAKRLVEGLRRLPIDAVLVGDASLIPRGDYCFSDGALRLVTVLAGRRRMGYAKQGRHSECMLQPGTWLMLPPHAPMWPQLPCRCHFIGLRTGAVSSRLHASRHRMSTGQQKPYLGLDMPPLRAPASAIEQALLEVTEEDAGQEACRRGLVAALLPVVARDLDSLPSGNEQGSHLLRQVCRFLQEHLHHGVDRNTAAHHFGLAPSSVSRLFARNGLAFNGYVNELRIDMAKQLLRNGTATVEQIAEACGYNNGSYLIKRFRQQLGCTPQQWRQRNG